MTSQLVSRVEVTDPDHDFVEGLTDLVVEGGDPDQKDHHDELIQIDTED